MQKAKHIIPLLLLFLAFPLHARQDEGSLMKQYADEYVGCQNVGNRLKLANKFFAHLLETGYIDEPIQFPAESHIDSVDVNVYYYLAEWHYGEGDYQAAIDCLTHATNCLGEVDDQSKSDVYALLGAAYFRLSAFDKAVKALNLCYELDKKADDFDRMSSTLNSIASVFAAAGKPKEAEKYILEAIAANSLTANLARRAVLFGTASEVYRSAGDMDEALEYARKALDMERLTGDSAKIGVRLSQLAGVQMGLSMIDEAQRSLAEAIPLLFQSKNFHSWGICQNQLGDILASKGRNDEAADYYIEAAMYFLKHGDKYNELHAREGLYEVKKSTSQSEAMMHLERAKQLKDSIYQNETSEALAKYNAIYYNDILQKENERIVQGNRTFLVAAAASFAVLLVLVSMAIVFYNKRQNRKIQNYEQHINQVQDQYSVVSRQFQNMVAEIITGNDSVTEDDRLFLQQLAELISTSCEQGITDVRTIALQLHVSYGTLRRRLSHIVGMSPRAFSLQIRMDKAKLLLLNCHDLPISEIAYRCGYSQFSNFTRTFKSHFGVMPSDMRTAYKK